MTQEDINALPEDGYKVDDYRLTDSKNKPSDTGDTEWPLYKYGLKLNGIDHMRVAGCRKDAKKLDEVNEEFDELYRNITGVDWEAET